MYRYHDSLENKTRLALGTCRCGSAGAKYDLDALVESALVLDPQTRQPLTSAPLADRNHKPYIFAVNARFQMRIGLDGDRASDPDATKHETLWENADVLAAGEIRFLDGVVVELNDHSGSYGTHGVLRSSSGFRNAVLEALTCAGVLVHHDLELMLIG